MFYQYKAPEICHVAHVVFRLSTGGLENVVVQLINELPQDQFRHTVVSLTDVDPQFASRIKSKNVSFVALNKSPGHTIGLYPKVLRLFCQLKPHVVHTCNLAAMELMPIAAISGVPRRIHAEHGWEMSELGGNNWKYRLTRRLCAPFVNHFVAVAQPLYDYLQKDINVPAERLHLIANGVDTDAFRPRTSADNLAKDFPFERGNHWTIGMVGRLVEIKNPMLLVEAMKILAKKNLPGVHNIRLAIVGNGPLADSIFNSMDSAGLIDRLWLPGARSDIPEILRSIDCFVLPSLSEAMSCTLQEAMASGLDIIATNVGGNPDLLENGHLGSLVPSNDSELLAKEIYHRYSARFSTNRGLVARATAKKKYSLDKVIARYAHLFTQA